jgi:PhnB protein
MKTASKEIERVEPIPQGYHSITPTLTVRGAGRAIEFYERAFGAAERSRMEGPDGHHILHAELEIGDSRLFVQDEMPAMGNLAPDAFAGAAARMYLYVDDVDRVFRQAVLAGAKPKRQLEDMFWGDRCGTVQDPFGYEWELATRVEEVPPEELERRRKEYFLEHFYRDMGGEVDPKA